MCRHFSRKMMLLATESWYRQRTTRLLLCNSQVHVGKMQNIACVAKEVSWPVLLDSEEISCGSFCHFMFCHSNTESNWEKWCLALLVNFQWFVIILQGIPLLNHVCYCQHPVERWQTLFSLCSPNVVLSTTTRGGGGVSHHNLQQASTLACILMQSV